MASLAWTGAVGLVACGAVGAALTATPQVPPEKPFPPREIEPVPDPEPLTARNRRVLRTDFLPRVTAALQPLALNGGEVAVTQLEAHDFRAVMEVELRHRDAPGGNGPTRIRLLLDGRDGNTVVRADPWGRGEFRSIDPHRPFVLLRVPELGIDAVLRSEPLERARAVLRAFPPDPRAAAAAVAHAARVDAALTPFRGAWRYHGRPDRRMVFAPTPVTGPDESIRFPADNGTVTATALQVLLEPDGRVRLWCDDSPYILSPDGRRLDWPGTGHWWEREPGG